MKKPSKKAIEQYKKVKLAARVLQDEINLLAMLHKAHAFGYVGWVEDIDDSLFDLEQEIDPEGEVE